MKALNGTTVLILSTVLVRLNKDLLPKTVLNKAGFSLQ